MKFIFLNPVLRPEYSLFWCYPLCFEFIEKHLILTITVTVFLKVSLFSIPMYSSFSYTVYKREGQNRILPLSSHHLTSLEAQYTSSKICLEWKKEKDELLSWRSLSFHWRQLNWNLTMLNAPGKVLFNFSKTFVTGSALVYLLWELLF